MSSLLCVKYIINSHFELQPKGYSHFTNSSLYGGKGVTAQSLIQGWNMVSSCCLRWEGTSTELSVRAAVTLVFYVAASRLPIC